MTWSYVDPKTLRAQAHARRTDPQTSHDAAAALPSERIRASQEAVLGLMSVGPACDEELADRARRYGVRYSPSGLRTRRSELVRMGKLVDSGERTTLRSGRRSIVWKIADARENVETNEERTGTDR